MIMPNNIDAGLVRVGKDADQYLILATVSRSLESKTHERPPSGGGIGIVRPSSHIPLSVNAPKISPSRIEPKISSYEELPKIFPYIGLQLVVSRSRRWN